MIRRLVILLALASACSEPAKAPKPEPVIPAAVSVVRVGQAERAAGYRAAGTVRALRRADVATRIMARIETMTVRVGDRVHAGQILATLERAAVSAAGNEAAAGLDLATTRLRRMERLYADSAVPIAELEAARATYRQAEARTSAARAEAGYATLVAPFAGVVTARLADPGDLAAPGQPVLVIEDPRSREIEVGVPPMVATRIRPGMVVAVAVGAEEQTIPARVAAVLPSADPISHTVLVRLTALAPVAANLTAVAEFPAPAGAGAHLTVPEGAVVERGELTGVFLVAPDSTARLRWVRLGRSNGGRREVLSGLEPDDLVVRSAGTIRDGDRVRPVIEPEVEP